MMWLVLRVLILTLLAHLCYVYHLLSARAHKANIPMYFFSSEWDSSRSSSRRKLLPAALNPEHTAVRGGMRRNKVRRRETTLLLVRQGSGFRVLIPCPALFQTEQRQPDKVNTTRRDHAASTKCVRVLRDMRFHSEPTVSYPRHPAALGAKRTYCCSCRETYILL